MTTKGRWRGVDSCRKSIDSAPPVNRRSSALRRWFVLAAAIAWCIPPVGHTLLAAAQAQPPARGSMAAALAAEPAGRSATVTFFNRPIVVLRARVLGRDPEERRGAAERVLEDLAAKGITGPVVAQRVDGGELITVQARTVFGITPPDVDELSGETPERVAGQTVARLEQALGEASEARAPGVLVRSAILALFATAAALAILWATARARLVVTRRLTDAAERTVARS